MFWVLLFLKAMAKLVIFDKTGNVLFKFFSVSLVFRQYNPLLSCLNGLSSQFAKSDLL